MKLEIDSKELIDIFAEVLATGYQIGMEQGRQVQYVSEEDGEEYEESDEGSVLDIKYICPQCGGDVNYLDNYCSCCGTEIDWD